MLDITTFMFANVLFSLAGNNEIQSKTGLIHYKNGIQVDRKSLLSRNDVVYLSPAINEHEALPVGNGRLCAVVWNTDGLNLQVNHANNVWYQNSSGRIKIKATPSLIDNIEIFDERLSLYDGTVKINCRSSAGEWNANITVVDELDVICINFQGKLKTPELNVELEQWRPSAKPFILDDCGGFHESLTVDHAPHFSRKTAFIVKADCPFKVETPKQENNSQFVTLTLSPKTDMSGKCEFNLYIANPFVMANVDPIDESLKLLDIAIKKGWHNLFQNNAEKWSKFWEKSLIYITSPDKIADYMENLWYLHLYWMGCAGKGKFAVKFNGGPFLMHKDMRGWGGGYWYQNTRELYWSLLPANHIELCQPLYNLYKSVLPVEKEMTKKIFGVDGAQYEETMMIDGNGDKIGNPYTCLYLTTGIELSLQLYKHYLFTRDENFLRDVVYPVMIETSRFYLNWVKKEEDGLYHIYPTSGKETYWRVKDAITDLVAIRRMFPIFIELSKRLEQAQDIIPKLQDVLNNLASYPVDEENNRWLPCIFLKNPPYTGNPILERIYTPQNTSHSINEMKNSENIECEIIYPWELAGFGREYYEMAINTYHARHWKQPHCGWDQSAIWAARLGLADDAVNDIVQHCRGSQRWPQGFWSSPAGTYWANGLVDAPYFDSSGVNAMSTSEMLLQSHDGIIRVFPAVPKNWNGIFQLRAERGFMVTSERSSGQVQYIEIESLFGDECKIANIWNEEIHVKQGGKLVLTANDNAIKFPTVKGKKYLIERVNMPVDKIETDILRPEPNNDVKFMIYDKDTPQTPTPNLPMIGITRDGLTACRIAASDNRDGANESIIKCIGHRQKINIVKASLIDESGQPYPASWVNDGKYSAETIANRTKPISYLLELPEFSQVSVIIWSYDRKGERYDYYVNGSPRKVSVDLSTDGKSWDRVADDDFGNIFGQPIVLAQSVKTRFIKIQFLDQNNNPVAVPCDEIDIY